MILASLIIYGLGSVLDRFVLARYAIESRVYLGILQIFIAVIFLILISKFHNGWQGIKHGAKNAGWLILVVAVFTVAHRFFFMEAISEANVGLVSGIKRSSVLFTTIIGGEIFHEKNISRKVFAVVVMLLGIFLLIS